MTLAEICVSGYLLVAIFAASLIWSALVASKRRVEKAKRANYSYSGDSPFRKRNTKPSRLQP
jgi:hypothetical protein